MVNFCKLAKKTIIINFLFVDLSKWSARESNRAIKDIVEKFGELCLLWNQETAKFRGTYYVICEIIHIES